MTVHEKLDYIMENSGTKYNSVTISLVYSNSSGAKETESITVSVGENGTFALTTASAGHNTDSFKVSWN